MMKMMMHSDLCVDDDDDEKRIGLGRNLDCEILYPLMLMMLHSNERELVWVEILDSEILCALMMMIIHSYKKLKWFG